MELAKDSTLAAVRVLTEVMAEIRLDISLERPVERVDMELAKDRTLVDTWLLNTTAVELVVEMELAKDSTLVDT